MRFLHRLTLVHPDASDEVATLLRLPREAPPVPSSGAHLVPWSVRFLDIIAGAAEKTVWFLPADLAFSRSDEEKIRVASWVAHRIEIPAAPLKNALAAALDCINEPGRGLEIIAALPDAAPKEASLLDSSWPSIRSWPWPVMPSQWPLDRLAALTHPEREALRASDRLQGELPPSRDAARLRF